VTRRLLLGDVESQADVLLTIVNSCRFLCLTPSQPIKPLRGSIGAVDGRLLVVHWLSSEVQDEGRLKKERRGIGDPIRKSVSTLRYYSDAKS
jgi:hypothetical protein